MLRFVQIAAEPVATATTLTLPLEGRIKSRLRVTLDDGRLAGVLLPRGSSLRDGDGLESDEGLLVRVRAAPETLSQAQSADALLLARACYHLGNRHVPLRIEGDRLAYLHDHVLDDLLRGLGLSVSVCSAPFEPEPGAYGGASSEHGHGHGHGGGHAHAH